VTRLLALACLLLVATPGLASAQVAVEVHRIVPQDPVMELVVGVDDAEGRPVTDLALTDFQVALSSIGDEEPIHTEVLSARSFVDAGMPFATLLLIDTSGSMRSSMEEVKEAARRYVAGMAGGDVAIIAQFNDTVLGLDQPWTDDKTELNRQIDALEVQGKETHLYEALNRGINMMASSPDTPALRNILVLSDGKDHGSPPQWTYDRARSMAGDKDVPISAVGYVVNAADDNTASLAVLSQDTGGRYSPAASVEQIEGRFRAVQHAIHALWVLSVETGPMAEGERRLKVSVSGNTGSARLDLNTWEGCPGCGPQEAWWEEHLAIIIGAAVTLFLLVMLLALLLRARARRAIQKQLTDAKDEARRAREQLEDKVDEKVAEALAEAEAARRVAEEAKEAPPPEPEPEPTPPQPSGPVGRPRQTMFQQPGGAAGGFSLLAEDGSRVPLEGIEAGPVPVGKDPARARIVLDHPTVSGHHADVSLQDGRLVVTDAGSANGTYVDGQDIRSRGPVAVRAGQRLQFGLLKTVVEGS